MDEFKPDETRSEHAANPPGEPSQPLVLIPVTAEDFARRKHRIWFLTGSAVVIALAIAGYLYKRSVDPIHAKQSYDAGSRLFETARYTQAILSFDRAVALKPDLVDAYFLRAKSYVALADPEHAISDFTRVIEMRPSDPTALIARGLAYLGVNDFASAIADANKALVIDPKFAAAYNLRGTIIRKQGNPRKALEDFTHAVEFGPVADNYYQRGATYQLLGEHKLAIADFTEVIGFVPDIAPAYFARSQSRKAIGDLAGAQQDYTRGRILDGH